jgi:sigma-B regulation protein RsbU (phosphoserine phosphatase)
VNSSLPPYLRLHVEDQDKPIDPIQALPGIESLAQRFETVTGWTLRFHETADSYRRRMDQRGHEQLFPQGKLAIDDMSAKLPAGKSACHRVRCEELVDSINELLRQLESNRTELWKRDAELATAVPVVQPAHDDQHIASRLQTSLSAALDATGAQAAALYVLDDATSELTLRSSVGLSTTQFNHRTRPLQGALADLEALLGHAVVIEDTELLRHWNPPEDFPAAACVPVSSATTPLGTLWVFDTENRDFTPEQTNLLEVIAGRIAAELEREVALAQSSSSVELEKEFAQARNWQEARLPNIEPVLDEVEVQGWTQQSGVLGGDFHSWTVLPDGNLAVALGDVQAPMVEAGLGAANLHALVQCHGEYQQAPGQVLSRVSESLWTGSMGDHFASLMFGVVDLPKRDFRFASAGFIGAVYLQNSGVETLSDTLPPLGGDPDHFYSHLTRPLGPGDIFLAFSDGVRHRLAAMGFSHDDEQLAEQLRQIQPQRAGELIDQLKVWLKLDAAPAPRFDMSLLVLRGR